MNIMAQVGTIRVSGNTQGSKNQLYNRVKTEGRTKYLKCSKIGCDGSAKIVGDQFFLGVCTFVCYY